MRASLFESDLKLRFKFLVEMVFLVKWGLGGVRKSKKVRK